MEIIQTNNNGALGWMTKKTYDDINSYFANLNKRFIILGTNKEAFKRHNERREKNKDTYKYAYVLIGNTKKLAFVCNETGMALKCDGYNKTNMELKRFKFIKWVSMMEL